MAARGADPLVRSLARTRSVRQSRGDHAATRREGRRTSLSRARVRVRALFAAAKAPPCSASARRRAGVSIHRHARTRAHMRVISPPAPLGRPFGRPLAALSRAQSQKRRARPTLRHGPEPACGAGRRRGRARGGGARPLAAAAARSARRARAQRPHRAPLPPALHALRRASHHHRVHPTKQLRHSGGGGARRRAAGHAYSAHARSLRSRALWLSAGGARGAGQHDLARAGGGASSRARRLPRRALVRVARVVRASQQGCAARVALRMRAR